MATRQCRHVIAVRIIDVNRVRICRVVHGGPSQVLLVDVVSEMEISGGFL